MWQDWVLMIGGFGFSIALIPSIFSKSKPNAKTSLMTGSILAVFAGVYGSLDMWLAMVGAVLCSTAWFILLCQKVVQRRS